MRNRPALTDVLVAGLADLGIMATAVPTQEKRVKLWLVTAWHALDPGALEMLSQAERARAARFASSQLSDRYIAAHVALRWMMERRVGIAAHMQHYEAGPHGKPWLRGYPEASFNLSYAGSRLLIGMAAGGALGVDIEQLRQVEDAAALAALYYSVREREALASCQPGSDRFDQMFLSIWTRKEACVKATGLGLGEFALPRIECGHADSRAVRVGYRQLRTDTTLLDQGYLLSWSWDRIGQYEGQAVEN